VQRGMAIAFSRSLQRGSEVLPVHAVTQQIPGFVDIARCIGLRSQLSQTPHVPTCSMLPSGARTFAPGSVFCGRA
jgi:hypothetical protein